MYFNNTILLALLCLAHQVFASKSTIMLPMRDGIQLYTVLFLQGSGAAPTVLIRTPYGTPSLIADCLTLLKFGFNAVAQDFRGRYSSQGTFVYWETAASDAYDTMEWISKQTWSNQKIFTYGGSANGIAQYLQPILSPPWLKGQSVIVASAQMHDTIYQGGAFREALIVGWTTGINETQALSRVYENERYSSFWATEDMTGKWQNINFPAVHVTGWYDIFMQQNLVAYEAYNTQSKAAGYNYLFILPGGHCAGGDIPWSNSSAYNEVFLELSIRMFLQLDKSDDLKELKNVLSQYQSVYYYVLGPGLPNTVGNYWLTADKYPLDTEPFELYLSANGRLEVTQAAAQSGQKTYLYDPSNPVPTIGGNNLVIACGPRDQSALHSRGDIVSFISDPVPQDTNLMICGKLDAELYVSSNATDTDFTVKLIDIFPDGRNIMIQDGIIRMKWRDDPSTPKLMTAGTVYKVTVDIWSTCYVFNSGHKARLDISSSNYPRFSANPNNGLLLVQNGPKLIAENTIYFGQDHPSKLIAQVPKQNVLLAKQ